MLGKLLRPNGGVYDVDQRLAAVEIVRGDREGVGAQTFFGDDALNVGNVHLQINARGTAHKIDTAALYWVESCGHDLVFHTAEGALTASGSMAETETRLAQDSFFRVNKGCLVNLEHVDCMDGEDAVVHGERVPIARARRKAFLDALNDYINGAG